MAITKGDPDNDCGVVAVLPDVKGVQNCIGTKFFTESGAEIKNVTAYEITGEVNSIRQIKLTVALVDIKFESSVKKADFDIDSLLAHLSMQPPVQ